jgi:hypothetical protein
MNRLIYTISAAILVGAMTVLIPSGHRRVFAAQSSHQDKHGHTKHSDRVNHVAKLLPAEGAAVKILSPKKEQIFTGDRVPLEFTLVKGKRGEHVHAYVNGELMGMFNSQTGTLTGIKPGRHLLELRVVAEDHKSELDATDKVPFTVR